jgi:hypothetical protein
VFPDPTRGTIPKACVRVTADAVRFRSFHPESIIFDHGAFQHDTRSLTGNNVQIDVCR